MQIEKYNSEKRTEWNIFNSNSKTPMFMFNREYIEYHKNRFTDSSLMFYDDKKELVAILPANLKDDILFSHGGLTYGGFIVGNSMKQHTMNDIYTLLLQYAKKQHISKILYKTIPHFYHKQPAEEDRYSLFLNNAELIKVEPSTVINLSQPLKMPKGRKAQIVRAKREKVEIKECEDFNTFISLENSILQEKHGLSAVHTGKELELLKSYFPNNIKLFAAFHEKKMIAGTVIYEYENVVHTQYMAADDIARKIGALDLTISTVIENYKENKKYLDFGISSEQGGKILNNGLISQKESFGGRTIVYETWMLKI